MSKQERDLSMFQIGRQPDDTTCGPTCLHAVYKYYGREIPLPELLEQVRTLEGGGTLGVHLGDSHSSKPVQTIIEANQTTEILLQAEPATTLQIQTEGRFASDDSLSVRNAAGHEFATILDRDKGRTTLFTRGFSSKLRRVGPLAPVEYTIVATNRSTESLTQTVSLGGEPSRLVELQLD